MASLFTRILKGEIPSEKVYEDPLCFAIKDIAPKGPVHLLVIPKEELPSLDAVDAGKEALAGHLLAVAASLAKARGLDQTGWRLVVNNGADAGQVVGHLHVHLIGGRELGDMA